MTDLSPELAQALQLATESLLENESLTADLDDEAAKRLLNWGIARTTQAHFEAVQYSDSESYLSDQMRGTRKLMRGVNNWTTSRAEKDLAGNLAALGDVLAHTGKAATPEQQTAFLEAHLSDSPAEFISNLRSFCDSLERG